MVVAGVSVSLCFYLEKFILKAKGFFFPALRYFRFEKHVSLGLS